MLSGKLVDDVNFDFSFNIRMIVAIESYFSAINGVIFARFFFVTNIFK